MHLSLSLAIPRTTYVPTKSPATITASHKQDALTQQLLKQGAFGHASTESRNLYTYLSATQKYIDDQQQPDKEIYQQDCLNIKTIIDYESKRKPGLNLLLASSIGDLVKHLQTFSPPFHQRFIFKDSNFTQHFVFADIKANPGLPPSIILIDSSTINNFNTHALYINLEEQLKSLPLFKNMVASIMDTQAQSSLADCLIFCCSFALKAHKHQELFSKWHTLQQKNKEIAPDKMSKNPYHATFKEKGYLVYSPYGLLPIDFFKHTHSKKIIDKELSALWAAPFEAIHAQQNLYAEMLSLKKQQCEQRYIGSAEKMSFLTSIEYKRRALILRALGTTSSIALENVHAASPHTSCCASSTTRTTYGPPSKI